MKAKRFLLLITIAVSVSLLIALIMLLRIHSGSSLNMDVTWTNTENAPTSRLSISTEISEVNVDTSTIISYMIDPNAGMGMGGYGGMGGRNGSRVGWRSVPRGRGAMYAYSPTMDQLDKYHLNCLIFLKMRYG